MVLENAPTEELHQVLDFCLEVGLPVCLADIGVEHITEEELLEVAEKACIPEESIHAMPFPIAVTEVAAAIAAADRLGSSYKARREAK
ncbi:Glycerol dehydrogenase [compost metagenome]